MVVDSMKKAIEKRSILFLFLAGFVSFLALVPFAFCAHEANQAQEAQEVTKQVTKNKEDAQREKSGQALQKAQEQSRILLKDFPFKPAFEQMGDIDIEKACEKGGQACLAEIEKAFVKEKSPNNVKRLLFIKGLYAVEAGEDEQAKEALMQIDGAYPLLQDYIDYYLGDIAFRENDFETARTHFANVPKASRLSLQARFMAAFAHAKVAPQSAKGELNRLIEAHPEHFRTPQAKYELAECIRASRPKKAWRLYFDVRVAEADGWLSALAGQRMETLKGAGGLSVVKKGELYAAEAEHYLSIFRYMDAAKSAKAGILTFPKTSKASILGRLYYLRARAHFRMRNYSRALKFYPIAKAKNIDKALRGRILYEMADAHSRKGQNETAIKYLRSFLKSHKTHALACKAQYLLGRMHMAQERKSNAIEAFEALEKAYPKCKLREGALWYVGWLEYKSRQYDKALWAFRRVLETIDCRFEKERAKYWSARIYEKKEEKAKAYEIFVELVRDWPLSYYSSLAAERLKRVGRALPKNYTQKKNLSDVAMAADLNIDMRPYLKNHHFLKGYELLTIQRPNEARREFEQLKEDFGKEKREEVDILLAYLYTLSRKVHKAIYLFRTRIAHFAETYPGEDNRSLWLMAYPTPYKDIVMKYTKEKGVDPMLEFALMREESSFQHDVVSFANAVGLTQIIRSTGRVIARQLGVKGFRLNDLLDPEVAIRFGSHHLNDLIESFNGNHALAISSYNAGEGATRRWMREFGDLPMDEFIEEIPYTQTRRYTRRVLKSYGIYRYLYTDESFGFELWDKPKVKKEGF